MSSILLEPIIPNLTKVGASGEQLRDLWKLFTKVKDNTQGGRRLENLYWRLWYQSSSTGQQKETEKISSLFQTWRGPGEDFKAAAVSKRRSPAASENCEEDVSGVKAVEESDAGEQKAALLTSSVRLEQGTQQDCIPASTGASTSAASAAPTSTSTSTSTVAANPGSTSFISIHRVSSNLKAMGAAAAAAAPPAAELKAPAIPVSILPKKAAKPAVTGKPCTTTPSKLSVGFFSETAAVQRPSAAITTATTPGAGGAFSKTSVGFMTAASSNSTTGTDAPAPAKANEHGARKKFFINSLSSVSSEESLNELAAPAKALPPAFHTASSSTNLIHNTGLSFFNKDAPPEPLAPEVPLKNPACPSNLSSLLKNPRRAPTRNVNILATAQYYRRRDADCTPQFLESESLRRCLQIDHKPLIDPSLAYGGDTPMTYSENPAAW